jgi:hypothetical protein
MPFPVSDGHQRFLAWILFVATLSGPSAARAQRTPGSPIELGFTIGATPNYPPAFRDYYRNNSLAGSLEGRLALRLASFWHADVRAGVVSGLHSEGPSFVCEACNGCSFGQCVAGPPFVGPYVIRDGYYESPFDGSSFATTRLGSDWTVLTRAGKEWRVGIGIGRMWTKHVWTPQVASSVHWDVGPLRGMVEMSLWRYTLQRTDITRSFLNGQLVDETVSQEPIHETTLFVNLGLALHGSGAH